MTVVCITIQAHAWYFCHERNIRRNGCAELQRQRKRVAVNRVYVTVSVHAFLNQHDVLAVREPMVVRHHRQVVT